MGRENAFVTDRGTRWHHEGTPNFELCEYLRLLLLTHGCGLRVAKTGHLKHPIVRKHARDEQHEAAKLEGCEGWRRAWDMRVTCMGLYLVQVSP